MGNPPYGGNNNLSKEQRNDLEPFFPKNKTMDYVSAWYVKSVQYIDKTNVKCAFVSTNSISQGEQVPLLWEQLMKEYGIHINFAHKTLSGKARLHIMPLFIV